MTKPPEYDQYMKSAQWRNISDLMKKLARFRCAHCGQGSTTLEVHHLTYERFGCERMSDLVVLCKPCHEKADKKRVAEQRAKGEMTRYENAYHSYMTKKHGEHYAFSETLADREDFEDWLREKQESAVDGYADYEGDCYNCDDY
jgi:hypothetical protein